MTFKQKLKDKRFKANEMKMLRLFFEYGDNITIERMAKIMGVKRSTIYRHHKTLRGIIDDYMELIVDDCNSFCGEDIRKFYFCIMVYIMQNKEIFLVFLKMHDREVLLIILMKNKENLLKSVGYKIDVEEYDLSTIYQVVFKVEK